MREKEFLPAVESKLGIAELNDMQKRMLAASNEKRDIMLLSPTGSGKTLAFTLFLLKLLKPSTGRIQAVIIAPSRELATQITQVVNAVAPNLKVTALYGGHKVEDEVNTLRISPDIVVATPGRLLDHIKRGNLDVLPVRMVVLDEFDKSLELGFEEDMRKILFRMKNVSRYVLTSATRTDLLPKFLHLDNPLELDYTGNKVNPRARMRIQRVDADANDKLESLLSLLKTVMHGPQPQKTIVFVNYRESAERTYDFLRKNGVDAVLYHGALDQHERETAVARFNNGSAPVLVATDLASRGLDIEGVENVIHYHQPLSAETFTHRNGRTARVDSYGDIYLLVGPDESLHDFVDFDSVRPLDPKEDAPLKSDLVTLRWSAGKKEKLSKGDLLGFLTKECGLAAADVGKINVFDHYALVAVRRDFADTVLEKGNSLKVKGMKCRVTRA